MPSNGNNGAGKGHHSRWSADYEAYTGAVVIMGLAGFFLHGSGKPDVHLRALPPVAYKDVNVGDEGFETVVFDVLVAGGTKVTATSARMDLFAGDELLESERFDSRALQTRVGVRYRAEKAGEVSGRSLAAEDEQFDIRQRLTEPTSLHLSRITYALRATDASGRTIDRKVDIPVRTYQQKTHLIFPLKGLFTVVNGTYSDFGHTERSQEFAIDVVPLGPHGELFLKDGTKKEDFPGWGREILAPAEGRVVYSRNDVPDQKSPGTIDRKLFINLPEPVMAAGGNCVVIDHGNNEFSFLAHMQEGSVRVRIGDFVSQGHVIGLLGCSGNATGPHVHYHLMNGSRLFRSDGLPVHFTNLDGLVPQRGEIGEAK